MSGRIDELIAMMAKYGVEEEESRVYLDLVRKGQRTVLQLSRDLGFGRTKIYRILRDLKDKDLVREEVLDYGSSFEASPVGNLDLILSVKKRELETLERSHKQLISLIRNFGSKETADSRVLNYKGIEGLKQILWNQRRARRIIRTFVSSVMSKHIDFDYGDEIRQSFIKNNVKIVEIRNEKHIARWTNLPEIVKSHWEAYYLSPENFKMEFEFAIYNDIFSVYHEEDGQFFCVEIVNSKVSSMMSGIFDFILRKSEKMRILNLQGEAEV